MDRQDCFLTVGYRGHWLHHKCRNHRSEWQVQLPDHTVLPRVFRSEQSARAFVRARMEGDLVDYTVIREARNMASGVILANYNDQPMAGISERDFDTLLQHLSEQVASCLGAGGDALSPARDALNNEWRDDMTVRQWLAAAGKRLGVDTSGCVGA